MAIPLILVSFDEEPSIAHKDILQNMEFIPEAAGNILNGAIYAWKMDFSDVSKETKAYMIIVNDEKIDVPYLTIIFPGAFAAVTELNPDHIQLADDIGKKISPILQKIFIEIGDPKMSAKTHADSGDLWVHVTADLTTFKAGLFDANRINLKEVQ